MESRVCGGCGASGKFLVLSTTSEDGGISLHRLAYLQARKDTPPTPDGSAPGILQASFYELRGEDVWAELFGNEPTLAQINNALSAGTLRLSRLIRSPSGIIRARIYDTTNVVLAADGDERCDWWPSLHKDFTVQYQGSTVSQASSPASD